MDEYGDLLGSEEILLHQLTMIGRLISLQDHLEDSRYSETIEGLYQKIWNDLNDIRPDLIARFILVEGIVQ